MNLPDPKSLQNNFSFLTKIQASFRRLRENDRDTDANLNKTIFNFLEFEYKLDAKTYENRQWKLKAFDTVRFVLKDWYNSPNKITVGEFDNLPETNEGLGIIESTKIFTTAFAAEADKALDPNLKLLEFIAKNSGKILIVGGIIWLSPTLLRLYNESRKAIKNG